MVIEQVKEILKTYPGLYIFLHYLGINPKKFNKLNSLDIKKIDRDWKLQVPYEYISEDYGFSRTRLFAVFGESVIEVPVQRESYVHFSEPGKNKRGRERVQTGRVLQRFFRKFKKANYFIWVHEEGNKSVSKYSITILNP